MKNLLIGVACIGLFVVGIVGLNEMGFRIFERYAPKVEQVRRTTYEQSRAFQEGTVRDIENLKLEYMRGNDVQKEALKSVIRHRLADVPDELLTAELRSFKSELENN